MLMERCVPVRKFCKRLHLVSPTDHAKWFAEWVAVSKQFE